MPASCVQDYRIMIEHRTYEKLTPEAFEAFKAELEQLCAKYRIRLAGNSYDDLVAELSDRPGFNDLENSDV